MAAGPGTDLPDRDLQCGSQRGGRYCRWLLSTHDRVEEDTLPLTHEFLAEMLGTQRPSVSIVLRMLQNAGLVRQRRGGIVITDRAGLEEVACECYSKIRRSYERLLPHTCPPADEDVGSIVS